MIPNPKTSTFTMAANATSQNVALPGGAGLVLSVFNRGPQDAFYELTADANLPAIVPTANAAGSALIAANQPAIELTLPVAADGTQASRFAAVSTGNSTLYFTRGKVI